MRKGSVVAVLTSGFLSCFCFGKAQVLLELNNDTIYSYSYSDGDEFNGKEINTQKWNTQIWPYTNVSQFFAYEKKNTRLEDGVAIFLVTKNDSVYQLNEHQWDSIFFVRNNYDSDTRQFRMRYAAGSIVSHKKHLYGLYELRFKIEAGKGTWPAFWFFGGDRNEEIDVFELKGEKTKKIHVDTHCPVGCDPVRRNVFGIKQNWGGWLPLDQGLEAGFNVITLDWKPQSLTWCVNGRPLAVFQGRFANPMNIYINTQVASDFSAFKPGPDQSTQLPNNFYVDYLRIWKLDSTVATLRPVTNFTSSPRFNTDHMNSPKKKRGTMYNKSAFRAKMGQVMLVLLSAGNLQVNVLGKISEEEYLMKIKGAFGEYPVPGGAGEKRISIDSKEKDLELIISSKEKLYSCRLKIDQ